MSEIELIVDFHKDAERQGPGSPEETLRAFALTRLNPGDELQVADIGCGTGSQTLSLASVLRKSRFTTVDLFPEFLQRLRNRWAELGLEDRLTTVEASMDQLPFDKEQFDLIWSEGSIYNMGFDSGIRYWRKFLKPGGCLAVSEVTWTTAERPAAIEDFWKKEYPQIQTASVKIGQLEEGGYAPLGYFVLSRESWIDNYYKPMEQRFSAFLQRHPSSELLEKVIDEHRKEIQLYMEYKDYYSYGFYVARRL